MLRVSVLCSENIRGLFVYGNKCTAVAGKCKQQTCPDLSECRLYNHPSKVHVYFILYAKSGYRHWNRNGNLSLIQLQWHHETRMRHLFPMWPFLISYCKWQHFAFSMQHYMFRKLNARVMNANAVIIILKCLQVVLWTYWCAYNCAVTSSAEFVLLLPLLLLRCGLVLWSHTV